MYSKILVPVDGSEPSMLGLNEAIKLAKSQGAQLKLVHILNGLMLTDAEAPVEYVDKIADKLRAEGQSVLNKAEKVVRDQALVPQTLLIESIGARAADVINQQAREWGADLIVMGTHGRRGVRRLVLGSDAELVVRYAPVPVLLVRAVA